MAAQPGNRCSWQQCTSQATTASRKCCQGCLTARYCNQECQRQHWKGGHRAECKLLAAERALEEGRWEDAEAACSAQLAQAQKLAPATSQAELTQRRSLAARTHTARAQTHRKLFKYDDAVDDARAALRIDPGNKGRAQLLVANMEFLRWRQPDADKRQKLDDDTEDEINYLCDNAIKCDASLTGEAEALKRAVMEQKYLVPPAASGGKPAMDAQLSSMATDDERLRALKLPDHFVMALLEAHTSAREKKADDYLGPAAAAALQDLAVRAEQVKGAVLYALSRLALFDGCASLRAQLALLESAPGMLPNEKAPLRTIINMQREVKKASKHLAEEPGQADSRAHAEGLRELNRRTSENLMTSWQDVATLVMGRGMVQRMRVMALMMPGAAAAFGPQR